MGLPLQHAVRPVGHRLRDRPAASRIHAGLAPPATASTGTAIDASRSGAPGRRPSRRCRRRGSARPPPWPATWGTAGRPGSSARPAPGQPQEQLHRVPAPALRQQPRPAARCTPRAPSRRLRTTANGGSYTATWRTGSPLAAASRASAPPDDMPYSAASPPAASISAARSSTSRSTAYGARVTALAAAPRSYATTLKRSARSAASGASVARPWTSRRSPGSTAGPCPLRLVRDGRAVARDASSCPCL